MAELDLNIFFQGPLPAVVQKVVNELPGKYILHERTRAETESGFVLCDGELLFMDADIGELKLDFSSSAFRRSHRGQNEILAKALGLAKGVTTVWDMTCGLAEDTFFMSQLGFKVSAFERSAFAYLLVREALERTSDPPFEIFHGDSIEILQKSLQERSTRPQGIYLDPMFPDKKKSALPRKEMQIFRKWVGGDTDASLLLDLSLKTATQRVVVKRPLKSQALSNSLGKSVTHSFLGTTIRYDFYSTTV